MSLVLKISDPSTVTVPVACELFGDNDQVITKLKLKVTFIKTKPKDWKQQTEDARASLDEDASNRLLFSKIKNIEGLPIEGADGKEVVYSGNEDAIFDVVKDQQWITDPLWLAAGSINAGKKSDSFQRNLQKNF